MSGFAFNFFEEEGKTEKLSISNDEAEEKDFKKCKLELSEISKTEKRSTPNDEAEERDFKKCKLELSENSPKQNPGIGVYKKCCWSNMIRECLEDTEIEKINCGTGKDGHPIILCCLNPVLVEARIVAQMEEDLTSKGISEAAKNRSDLIPKVYEGGLKVWECAIDLVKYLSRNVGDLYANREPVANLKGKTVLELGCGAGLPGIWALQCEADNVHFQDYNEEVLLGFTMPNVLLNEGTDGEEKNVDNKQITQEGKVTDSCHFHSGDWLNLMEATSQKFDLILASETIYNTDDLQLFCDTLVHFLDQGGVALVSAKEYYFGVGGGVKPFLDVVEKNGSLFVSKIHWIEQNGVRRAVLEVRLKEDKRNV